METDGTMVAVGTAGPAQAGAPVAMPPPHGIDALPYADKDYEVPGAREAVSVFHTHALLAADLITPACTLLARTRGQRLLVSAPSA
jgi:hypothetical protein